MFGAAHLPELMIILVVALVVFGPKRLPEIGGALGKGIKDFKHGMSGLSEMHTDHELPEATVSAPVTSMPVTSTPVASAPVTSTPVASDHIVSHS